MTIADLRRCLSMWQDYPGSVLVFIGLISSIFWAGVVLLIDAGASALGGT